VIEVVVNLEGELISSLEELDAEIRKNIRMYMNLNEYGNYFEYLCIKIQ